MSDAAHTPASKRIRVERLGVEGLRVLVIEALLTDPDPLLALAHRVEYSEPRERNFPGLRAPAPAGYVRLLAETLSPLLHDVFGLGPRVMSAQSHFSLVTQKPDTLTLRQRIPHSDGVEPTLLALLHYLTPARCFGTSFYKHRSTGFERITEDRRLIYHQSLGADLEANPPQGYICGDTSHFQCLGTFDGIFNRLLVYQGQFLHSGDVLSNFDFSSDPRLGQLTVNTFFTIGP